jgi:hypothetical protein
MSRLPTTSCTTGWPAAASAGSFVERSISWAAWHSREDRRTERHRAAPSSGNQKQTQPYHTGKTNRRTQTSTPQHKAVRKHKCIKIICPFVGHHERCSNQGIRRRHEPVCLSELSAAGNTMCLAACLLRYTQACWDCCFPPLLPVLSLSPPARWL